MKTLSLYRFFLIILLLTGNKLLAQAPNITYTSPQVYTTGTPITTLSPVNTGGAVPANVYGTVITFAGSASGASGTGNNTGTSAKFHGPNGLTVDASGNIYVADQTNNMIRAITPGAAVSLLAGATTAGRTNANGNKARFSAPYDVTLDGSGNLYVADFTNNEIRKIIISSKTVTLLAGSSSGSSGTTNSTTGTNARFHGPSGIVYSSSASLMYVADYTNNEIRTVTTTGSTSLFAGSTSGASGTTNASGTSARFNHPYGVTVDASGNVYVSDYGNNQIRKITPAGAVTLFAGDVSGASGSADGTGSAASFNGPMGLSVDVSGNLYVYDSGNALIRMITPAGVVTTIAGSGTANYTNGIGTAAEFDAQGLTVDLTTGDLLIGDYGNNAIRKFTGTGYTISPALPAGLSFDGSTGDISGTPSVISGPTIYTITAFNVDGSSSTTVTITTIPPPPIISYSSPVNIELYTPVGTIPNSAITVTNTGGTVSATFGYNNTPTQPFTGGIYDGPAQGAVDTSGNVYISNYNSSTISAFTQAGALISNDFTSGTTLVLPAGIAFDSSGNMFVLDNGNFTLNKFNSGGVFQSNVTLPIGAGGTTLGLAIDANDNMYITGFNGSTQVVYKVTAALSVSTLISSTGLNNPVEIGIDNSGNLYVLNQGSGNVSVYNTAGTMLTGTFATGYTGSYGLTVDRVNGYVYVSDSANSNINIYATGTTSGAAVLAAITGVSACRGITTDLQGNIYAPDFTNNLVYKYSPTGQFFINKTLPGDLSFNKTTGEITGTATVTTPATNYAISGYNVSGGSAATINIITQFIPPSIDYDPQALIINEAVSILPENTGGYVPANVYGTVSTFAGSTSSATGTTNATGTSARFNKPAGLTIDNSGTLFIADNTNNEIRQATSGAVITLLAGSTTGTSGTTNSNTPTSVRFHGPNDITLNPATGTMYVADLNNNEIRQVTSAGATTLLAGSTSGTSGSTNANGTSARFNAPSGIVYDPVSGNLYVADANNNEIRQVTLAGAVTLFAGSTSTGTTNGALTSARFNAPSGIAVDAAGNLYVADKGNNQIRKISGGTVSLLAGSPSRTSGNADGVGTSATFNAPGGLVVDMAGNVYVSDGGNNIIRMITPDGTVTTIAGDGTAGQVNGVGTAARFSAPKGLSYESSTGNIYVADYSSNAIREIIGTGYSISPTTLPTGLTFDATTGGISGTPTVTSAPADYTVTAYNRAGISTTVVNISVGNVFNWDGSSSSDWGTAANWSGGSVPGPTDRARIGVSTTTITNLPVIPNGSTINIGSVMLGTRGNVAATITVDGTGILNVTGDVICQSDASSYSHRTYTTEIGGTGTINAINLDVVANKSISGTIYTETLTSSVSNLNLSGDITLTSNYFTSSRIVKAALNITGGTITANGIQTTNSANAASTSDITLSNGATINLNNATPLANLSVNGVNTLTFNTGSTIGYTGSNNQTVYTDDLITGLSGGISYQNIAFGGTGIKTALTGNLNVAGNFTNTLANDASNYVNLSAVPVLFNGSTQTLAGGSGNGTTLVNTTFSGGGTKTISSGMFNIASTGTLNITGNSTLAAGGFLTLQSDSSSSATVPAIPTGSSITGNVNVQRYLSGGQSYSRGYRLLSSPVSASSGSLVYPNLDFIKNSTYTTGSGGTTNGFDASGNPTIYLYREDIPPNFSTFISGNSRGVAKINTGSTFSIDGDGTGFNIPAGNGVLMFFRGDKTTTTNPTSELTIAQSTILTSTGYLNQGDITIKNWFTPTSSNLSYTPATPASVRGFNLVGNPYASSINWDNISGINISNTIWVYNPTSKAYSTYIAGNGGIGTGTTGNTANIIPSGQGFYVKTTGAGAALTFTEAQKVATQVPAVDLLLATAPVNNPINYLRIKLTMDSVNTDDALIFFKPGTSTDYLVDEDAAYLNGVSLVNISTISTNNVSLAINQMPYPATSQTIPLNVNVTADGSYTLSVPEIKNIPQTYDIWLMDAYKKDSVNVRTTLAYIFNAMRTDTNTFGKKRFSLVIRQNSPNAYQLLDFAADKLLTSVQLTWKTLNELNNINFIVERSTDGGVNYLPINSVKSSGQGTYSFIDTSPSFTFQNLYRLKQDVDNGATGYSAVIPVTYVFTGNAFINSLNVYPNPSSSTINVVMPNTVNNTASSYNIIISSISGNTVKTISTSQTTWQGDISKLAPGTYFIKVLDNKKAVGQGKFIKL